MDIAEGNYFKFVVENKEYDVFVEMPFYLVRVLPSGARHISSIYGDSMIIPPVGVEANSSLTIITIGDEEYHRLMKNPTGLIRRPFSKKVPTFTDTYFYIDDVDCVDHGALALRFSERCVWIVKEYKRLEKETNATKP